MRLRTLPILIILASMLVAAPTAPAASVAGTNGKIVFASNSSGKFEIYSMNADGSAVANVSGSLSNNVDPALSPDGTKVVFASDRYGSYNIFVANLDGSGVFRLTGDPTTNQRAPVWSPDGNSIAYQSDQTGGYWGIFVMQANGSGQTGVAPQIGNTNNRHPAWAPDGGSIVFDSDQAGGGIRQIWSVTSAGANPHQLVFSGQADCNPAFSPDSAEIAYIASCGTGSDHIMIFAPGQTPALSALSPLGSNDTSANWSPDGQKVTFASNRSGDTEVWTMNVDGSGAAQITTTAGAPVSVAPNWGANLANVRLPTVAGAAVVGATVVAGSGSWLGQGTISFAYQWMRCNLTGDGCQQIGGATGVSYELTSVDVNGTIRVRVTATNPSGSAKAMSGTIGAISGPSGPGLPSVSGSLTIGSTLTSTTGSVGVSLGLAPVLYTFQWLRCDLNALNCAAIAGATSPTYVLVSADSQQTIRVTATGTNASGSASGTSLATAVVGGLAPANVVLPVIAGQPVIGQTLAASTGNWTGAANASFTYQWETCSPFGGTCFPLPAATGSAYVVAVTDVGFTLIATVTAITANGIVSIDSLPTSIAGASYADPGPGFPGTTIEPRLLGNAMVGSTLKLTDGGFVGANLSYAYQWQRCDTKGSNCGPVPGARAASYKVKQADHGWTIRAFVTVSNPAGSVSTVSDGTATVVSAPSVQIVAIKKYVHHVTAKAKVGSKAKQPVKARRAK